MTNQIKELEAIIIKLIALSDANQIWVGENYIVFGNSDIIYQNRLEIPEKSFVGMKSKDYTKEAFIKDYEKNK